MFVLGNFLSTLAYLVKIVLWAYTWIIIVRALISWVSPDPFNPIVQFLYKVTEPVLEPIRRLLPPLPIDISPLIVLVLISVLNQFLVGTLYDLAIRLH